MREDKRTYIGIDLGGTKMLAARINHQGIQESRKMMLPVDNGDPGVVIRLIIQLIESILSDEVAAIGIGLPSIVDSRKGIVYDVCNIPSWKEVHLAEILRQEFDIPVYMENDANCYALGELYFGKAQGCSDVVGITIGTGMGAGIIKNGRLLPDANGAAGEFGILPYRDATLEDYCSGQYFKRTYNQSGEALCEKAKNNDAEALSAFAEFGFHLGQAIKIIMSTVDPKRIILGGSIALSKAYFADAMWNEIQSYPYRKSVERIEIEFSNTNDMAVLGAAVLCDQNIE